LRISHANGFRLNCWFKGFARTLAAALLISIASYIAIPEHWIFFGVLHFIALSYVLAVPFLSTPILRSNVITLLCSAAFILMGALEVLPGRWPFHLVFDGLPRYTNDYVRIFPWLGMVLIGICLGQTSTLLKDPLRRLTDSKWQTRANWLSKHSLVIYLAHQPILFALILAVSNVLN
jgi:uncharacterized membrane protein